ATNRVVNLAGRADFGGRWITLKEPLGGFDLARQWKLHADNAERAPCDAAPANARIEYAVLTPRHNATHPARTIAPRSKSASEKFSTGPSVTRPGRLAGRVANRAASPQRHRNGFTPA